MCRFGRCPSIEGEIMRKLLLIIFLVALAVTAVNAATASAALNVCVKSGNGGIRAVSGASACAANETAEQLATSGELAAQQARVTTLETQIVTLHTALAGRVDALETQNTELTGRVDALETLLAGVSRVGDTLLLTRVNLQVVNGTGQTDNLNGLGNVIVGYNEAFGELRTGSHNLVVGPLHSYSNHSGITSGYNNVLSGAFAVVTGIHNEASGANGFVGGGRLNKASGISSFVGGGEVGHR
jgi:uncharacterized protein YraI